MLTSSMLFCLLSVVIYYGGHAMNVETCSCSGHSNRYEWNIGDTFCQCHLAAVTELIGDEDDAEVVYSIWRDEVKMMPCYVCN